MKILKGVSVFSQVINLVYGLSPLSGGDFTLTLQWNALDWVLLGEPRSQRHSVQRRALDDTRPYFVRPIWVTTG